MKAKTTLPSNSEGKRRKSIFFGLFLIIFLALIFSLVDFKIVQAGGCDCSITSGYNTGGISFYITEVSSVQISGSFTGNSSCTGHICTADTYPACSFSLTSDGPGSWNNTVQTLNCCYNPINWHITNFSTFEPTGWVAGFRASYWNGSNWVLITDNLRDGSIVDNIDNNGTVSRTLEYWKYGTPGTPTNLSPATWCNETTGSQGVGISWSGGARNCVGHPPGDLCTDEYYVEGQNPDGSWFNRGWETSASWTISVGGSGTWKWHVKQRNGYRESAYSSWAYIYKCPGTCQYCSGGSCITRGANDTTECNTCYRCDGTNANCQAATANEGKNCTGVCTYCSSGSCAWRSADDTTEGCSSNCYDCVSGSCQTVTEANDGGCNNVCNYCSAGTCTNRSAEDTTEGCSANCQDCVSGSCQNVTQNDDGACNNVCTSCVSGSCNNRSADDTTEGCSSDCYDCVSGSCQTVTEANDGGCNNVCNYCSAGTCTNRSAEDTTEGCSSNCYDCVSGSCQAVTENNDGTCTGVCTYCSSGTCTNRGADDTAEGCSSNCYDCVSGSCQAVTENEDGTCTGVCTYCSSGTCTNRGADDTTEGCATNCYDCVSGTCTAMTENNDGTCNAACTYCNAGACTNRAQCAADECSGQLKCDAAGGNCADPDANSTVCTVCYGKTWDPVTSDCCGDDGTSDNWCNVGDGSCVSGIWYSNHCSDGVQNCDETGVDCGGADCVSCDTVAPTVSVTGAPANWQNTDAAASVNCTDNTGGSGCNSTTYKLKTYTSNPTSCSTIYSEYNSFPTISSHVWVCGAAKDNANNAGFSSPVEFKVDKTAPQVTAFSVSPTTLNIANPASTISWTVTDTGGSHLDHVEVLRANYNSTNCSDTNKTGCVWAQVGSNYNAPTDSDSWSSSATDSPTDGTYWYGLHVLDKAGNMGTEPPPVKVIKDTVRPPKPTCSPGTGTYIGSVTVTCSNAESGVTTRYTTDGTAPTVSSSQYTSPLIFTNITVLTIASWDGAANRSDVPDNVYTYTVGNLPDTIIDSGPAGITNQTSAIFTFHGTNSPTSYQCKLDTGSWAVCTSPKSYTVIQGSHTFQVKAINAFGEDPTPASWSWLVDTTNPVVSAFSISPTTLNIANPASTISWTVTDTGGSHLDHVEVLRANYNSTNCSDTNKTGCVWAQVGSNYNAPTDSDSWSSSATDSPTDGTYWYGLHVLDKAGNLGTEPVSPGPIKVQVDKTRPTSAIYRWNGLTWESDSGGSWQKAGFTRRAYDSDSGLGLDKCYYYVYDNVALMSYSGIIQRTCSALLYDISVTVGSSAYCRNQAENGCSLYVYSTDKAGNQSENGVATYHIDWTSPTVGQTSPTAAQQGIAQTFSANVSDNLELGYCWLYVDGAPITGSSAMIISPASCQNGASCVASKEYTFASGGTHTVYARCADHWESQIPPSGGYLNFTSGASVNVNVIANNPPQITSGPSYTTSPCASPTTQTGCNVNFAVSATDADGDSLTYTWRFGASCPPYGDVDMDGNLDADDVTLIANYAVGGGAPSKEQKKRADVNADGLVNINDAMLLGQYINGTRTSLPACGTSNLQNPSHYYGLANTYPVLVTVSDGRGGIATGGISVPVANPTLSVALLADPSVGIPPLNGVDLTAQVSGNMFGTINYKFDCTNDGTWESEINNTTANPYTALDLCDYPSLGTYTAKVFVEKGEGCQGVECTDGQSCCQARTTNISVVESLPPTCQISVPERAIVNQVIDIGVGGSSDPEGKMASVNFSSDNNLNAAPDGSWDPSGPYDWKTSLGNWNAVNKTMKWSFAETDNYEVWAEVKDDANLATSCYDTIAVTECLPGETKSCTSAQGCTHVITCKSDGAWPSCPTDDCTQGATRSCDTTGTQTCNSVCSWGVCVLPSDCSGSPPSCSICQHPVCSGGTWSCQPDAGGTDCGDCQRCDGTGVCRYTCSGSEPSCECVPDWCIDCSMFYDPSGPTYGYQGVCQCGALELPAWACINGRCSCVCWAPPGPPPPPSPFQAPPPPYTLPPQPITCQRNYPNVVLTPPTQSGAAGQQLSFTVSVINNDSAVCDTMYGPSNFFLTKFCYNWSCFFLNLPFSTLTVPAGQSRTTTLKVTSPSSLARGNYNISVTAVNLAPPYYARTGYAVYNVSNNSPRASNLSVDGHNPTDYCFVAGYPPVRVRWQFNDYDLDSQSGYEIEVYEGLTKVVDTGYQPGSNQSHAFTLVGERLSFGTTYSWRLKVWDSSGAASDWVSSPTSFTTIYNAYPWPDFAWSPSSPTLNEVVQFCSIKEGDCSEMLQNKQTVFSDSNPAGRVWSWNFGDSVTSPFDNPTHPYSEEKAYGVSLSVTDSFGYGPCVISYPLSVTKPLPQWREIPPR